MRTLLQSLHWSQPAALVALALFTAGCASKEQKEEKALKKEPGTTEWYAERERKHVTKVKDKHEPKEMGYNRGQSAGWNPGTGLLIPKPGKMPR